MMRNMRTGLPNLFKSGSKQYSGVDQTALKNIEACKKLADITRTSMGPTGMNKMVINYLEKLFVTSDAATIIKEMDIVHPAAKMVVLAAAMQEKEIGDGSNFVLVFAGELCQMAEELIHQGVHTKDIVAGFNSALKHALSVLEELVVLTESDMAVETMARGMKSAISAKLYGYEDFLCPLIAKACASVMPKEGKNFAVDNVRVCKVVGGQVFDSEVINGLVVDHTVEGTCRTVENATVALFVNSIDSAAPETKGTVLIKDAQQLLDYNIGEEEFMEKMITQFRDSGVNVLVCGSNISDVALHFLDKYNILAVKIQSKFELRRICRAVKCRPLVQFGPVSKEQLGHCGKVYVREIGSKKVTVFLQSEANTPVSTILIRGSTQNLLDDVERAIDDGVNVSKAMGKDPRFVAGGGAFEIELAKKIREFGAEESSVAQYSIKKFAEALEVIPRSLAESSGMNHTTIVSDLIAAHSSEQKDSSYTGVDIDSLSTGNMVSQGIVDLFVTKRTGLKLATDAVVTILRVDQIIMAKPAGGPKVGGADKGHWDRD